MLTPTVSELTDRWCYWPGSV